ncbi:g6295 [Coccomyxa viridis]|uniref:G6295 protein n=1 Tax=Coccomyxa viridis TaxID=1274662 RepID=A0ABP1FV13_9CHLO
MHKTNVSTSMSRIWILEGGRRGHVCQWAYRPVLKESCRSPLLIRPHRQNRIHQGVTAKAGRDSQATKSSRPRETLLTLESVGRTHDGHTQLFSNVSATLTRGERLAVVGPNGCGKTTLLRLIAGVDEPDSGAVRKRNTSIGYLPQSPELDEGLSAFDAILHSGSILARCVLAYEQAIASGDQKAMDAATEEMNRLGGWEFREQAEEMLKRVGLPNSGQLVGSLSGGQKRRVALAAALLANPDLIVADEPTNHMDHQVIRWLEQYLTTQDISVVVVTHDRAFMESVCTSVLELEAGETTLHNFGGPGSYDRFRQLREERRAAKAAAAADAKRTLRKETEWMRRQPKARSTKSTARIKQFYELTAKARDVPQAEVSVDFDGETKMKRQGRKVMELKGASYSVNSKEIVSDFWYSFYPGERIGVVGPNGAGKSTMLNLIAGSLPLTSGEREIGETTAVGFFQQEPPTNLPQDMSMADYLRSVGQDAASTSGRGEDSLDTPTTVLERVGFARNRHYTKVRMLSGGECRRLQLAAVLMSRPNLLILDEPTNDLDLATVESMESFLAGYGGCLLVASHDRAFMEGLDRLFVLRGDGVVRLFEGPYSEYLEIVQAEDEAAAAEQQAQTLGRFHNGSNGKQDSTPTAKPQRSLRMGFREKQEYESLEGLIDTLSAEKQDTERELAKVSGDYERMLELSQRLDKLAEQIDAKTERWLELAEMEECAQA